VSTDGRQAPLPKEVVEESIKKRSFVSIRKLINSWQNHNARQSMSTESRTGSVEKLLALEPLLTFQTLSSPIIPMLTSMMHALGTWFFVVCLFSFVSHFGKKIRIIQKPNSSSYHHPARMLL
jgi:hypothetical protein